MLQAANEAIVQLSNWSHVEWPSYDRHDRLSEEYAADT